MSAVSLSVVRGLEDRLIDPLKLDYLATHFWGVNYKLDGGFRNSELIILAARPSMGKTSLALSFVYHLARRGASVGFFSL